MLNLYMCMYGYVRRVYIQEGLTEINRIFETTSRLHNAETTADHRPPPTMRPTPFWDLHQIAIRIHSRILQLQRLHIVDSTI